jgi:hypothetical protein
MNENSIRFVAEIIKPWESLNVDLGKPFSMNPAINDFTTWAYALAVSIKHIPEACLKAKPRYLGKQSRPYEVMSDLADSFKHGSLSNLNRQCNLVVGSMFERNSAAKVRFLRNRITITHSKYGKIDFMQYSLESALFIFKKMEIQINWLPKILNNSGEFSDEIKVHASNKNQVVWTGMQLEFVKLNDSGDYINVDLNGTVKFMLTSEF